MGSVNKNPSHPGRILYWGFIDGEEMSLDDLAAKAEMPLELIQRLVDGKDDMTPDMAAGLARVWPALDQSYWMRFQEKWEASLARMPSESKGEEVDAYAPGGYPEPA